MVIPRGRTSLGCLFVILLLAAGAYAAANIGPVYWRAYKFEDAMRQEARFADKLTDQQVQRHLELYADSLGLPPEAQDNLEIARARDGSVSITTKYDERVALPLFARTYHFSPHAEGSF